jgi:hypothetical protein
LDGTQKREGAKEGKENSMCENFKFNAVINVACSKCGKDEVIPIVFSFEKEDRLPKGWVLMKLQARLENNTYYDERLHYFCEPCAREVLPGYFDHFDGD